MIKEISLNPRLKIDSFKKLQKALKGKTTLVIRCTARQYEDYSLLFPRHIALISNSHAILYYNGAKLLLHTKLFTGFDTLPK